MIRDYLLGVTFASGAWLLATAVDAISALDINPGAVGSTGFAIWYGWYVTTKVIPGIVEKFAAENQATRDNEKANRQAFLLAMGHKPQEAASEPASRG